MIRALTPTALLAFARSAELGSFAAAAKELSLSPAAVGQAVQRLEEGFGVKLLQRTTRRMRLTTEGHTLLMRSRALVGELAALEGLFEESRAEVKGALTISAPTGLSRRHVLPLVARFAERYPDVEVSLDGSDALRNVAAGEVDVAFRLLRPADSAVITRRLARVAAVTVAAPSYLARHGTPRHPRELADRRCLVYRHPATGALAPMVFRSGRRELVIAPRPRIVVNDVDTGCDAAVLGLGIAQPPEYYVASHLASGRLVPILAQFAPAPWTLYLCYAGRQHLPARVRAFVEFAQAELGGSRGALSSLG